MKRLLLAVLFLPLQACSLLHYYPGKEGVGTCRGCTYEECNKRNGKPDEEIKNTDGTMLLAYHTGRNIFPVTDYLECQSIKNGMFLFLNMIR